MRGLRNRPTKQERLRNQGLEILRSSSSQFVLPLRLVPVLAIAIHPLWYHTQQEETSWFSIVISLIPELSKEGRRLGFPWCSLSATRNEGSLVFQSPPTSSPFPLLVPRCVVLVHCQPPSGAIPNYRCTFDATIHCLESDSEPQD